MKLFNCLLCFFVCISLGRANPKLDSLWTQVKERIEARKSGQIDDNTFIEWYMVNVRRVLSRREMRIAVLGLPDTILDKKRNELSQQAINGEWRNLLFEQWGKWGNEVYNFWSDINIEDLRMASKKECILFAEVLHFKPTFGNQNDEIEICDSPIGAKSLFWAFIYGKEVLSYPKTANLQPLFYLYGCGK